MFSKSPQLILTFTDYWTERKWFVYLTDLAKGLTFFCKFSVFITIGDVQ